MDVSIIGWAHTRFGKLEGEMAELRASSEALRAQWEAEKSEIGKVREVKQQIEETRLAIEQAERAYDLNKVAELKYGKLAELERQLQGSESSLDAHGGKRLLKEEVDEEDVAEVVSRWTGVPVSKLVEGEREKLVRLADHLHERQTRIDAREDGGGEEVVAVLEHDARRLAVFHHDVFDWRLEANLRAELACG